MNTEQIEAVIDKVLKKRGAAGSSYFTAKRSEVKADLLAAISDAQKAALIADYQRAADAMRWSAYSSGGFPAATARVQPMSVMVGSEHSGPDLAFLDGKSPEKTYVIELIRSNNVWKATILEVASAHHNEIHHVDSIYGSWTESRWDVLNAAKVLIRDLRAPQTVRVNAEGTVIQ